MIFLQVEKEIGQVWRQMGIMYAQVSSSISILEKVETKISTDCWHLLSILKKLI